MNKFLPLLLIVLIATPVLARDLVFPADSYGYRFEACGHDWIDISDTPALAMEPVAPHAGADEGSAVVVPVQPFPFYGQLREALVVSTNGYFSLGEIAAEDGGDFRAVCPLPAVPTNGRGEAARVYVLHGDLEGHGPDASVNARSFSECPRGGGACTVIQWSDWGYHDAVGNLVFQSVLYSDTGEIAFQYQTLNAELAGLTVGVQDDRAARGATLQCGQAVRITAGSSWCLRGADPDLIFASHFEG